MYSDEVNLRGSNVMGVLYLAKKYVVSSLSDECTEYLKENLDSSNVLSILSCAQTYEEKSLEEQCWKGSKGVIFPATRHHLRSTRWTLP